MAEKKIDPTKLGATPRLLVREIKSCYDCPLKSRHGNCEEIVLTEDFRRWQMWYPRWPLGDKEKQEHAGIWPECPLPKQPE